jgi:hypothetical protein
MGKKIPTFSSYEEEAEFWDTTDITTIDPSELEEVEIEVSTPLSVSFAVRLDPPTVAALRATADRRGLGVTQLVRSWILERLAIEAPGGSTGRESALQRRIHVQVVDQLMAQVPEMVSKVSQNVTRALRPKKASAPRRRNAS